MGFLLPPPFAKVASFRDAAPSMVQPSDHLQLNLSGERGIFMSIYQSLKRYSQVWYTGYSAQGGIGLGLAPIFVPLIVAPYAHNTGAGIIVAMFYFAQMLAPVFGWLSDRFNLHRPVFISSFILVGIGIGAFPLFNSMLYWLFMSFLLGLGIGAANTVSEMFIIEFQPREEWDARISVLQTYFGVGQAVGLYMAFLLSSNAHFALYLAGFLMAPSLAIGLVQLPHVSKRNRVKRGRNSPGPTHVRFGSMMVKHLHHLRHSLTNLPALMESLFMLYIASWFFIMLGNWLIYNLYPLLMSDVFSMNASGSSLYFAIGSSIAVFFCPLSGWMANKIGEMWVVMMGIGMSLVAALGLTLLSLFPVSGDNYLVPIAFIFLPVAWSPLIIVGTAVVTRLTDMARGEALGIFTATTAVASLIAAIVAGLIADHIGFTKVLMLSAGATIIGLVLMAILMPLAKERMAESAN